MFFSKIMQQNRETHYMERDIIIDDGQHYEIFLIVDAQEAKVPKLTSIIQKRRSEHQFRPTESKQNATEQYFSSCAKDGGLLST